MTDLPPMVPSAKERALKVCQDHVGFDRPDIGIARAIEAAYRDGDAAERARQAEFDKGSERRMDMDLETLLNMARLNERARLIGELQNINDNFEYQVAKAIAAKTCSYNCGGIGPDCRSAAWAALRAAADYLEKLP